MFDARPATPVEPPHEIAEDPSPTKARGDELTDSAIAAVGQHTTMLLT